MDLGSRLNFLIEIIYGQKPLSDFDFMFFYQNKGKEPRLVLLMTQKKC